MIHQVTAAMNYLAFYQITLVCVNMLFWLQTAITGTRGTRCTCAKDCLPSVTFSTLPVFSICLLSANYLDRCSFHLNEWLKWVARSLVFYFYVSQICLILNT